MKHPKTILALLLACLCTFCSNQTQAQEKKVAFVEQAEASPFAGILMTAAAYADLKFRTEENEELFRLRLDTEVTKAVLPVQLKLNNEIANNDNYRTMCTDRLASKNKTILFYESKLETAMTPTVWEQIDFPVGIGLGVISTVLLFIAVDSMDDNFLED